MRILLVEDDENKRLEVGNFLRGLGENTTVVEARSYQSALRLLRATAFDRVVMDMTMPTFDITVRE